MSHKSLIAVSTTYGASGNLNTGGVQLDRKVVEKQRSDWLEDVTERRQVLIE